jgi:K+-sensing histidine kinase KdpD
MTRGRLRVYLGAAPGVGKTYAMLAEARRRAARGSDVVAGIVETHGRAQTAELLDGLEIIPRRPTTYHGATFEEMDVDAILARRPAVALVDELAHTNLPGGRHAKRWQDVEDLLAAGIDVLSTVNIQHLESLCDVVAAVTGVPQRETIPDDVVRRADQVELVDMAPEALRRRIAHGNVYPADRVGAALVNFFRVGNLTALRELALLWVADKVDEQLDDYRAQHGIARRWEARERVVVALTGGREGEVLVRRGARIAGRVAGGELLAVHVTSGDGLVGVDRAVLRDQRQLVESLGGSYHEVVGHRVAEAVVDFARGTNASQLVLGVSRRGPLGALLGGRGTTREIVRRAGEIDVHLVNHPAAGKGRRESAGRVAMPGLLSGVTLRRRRLSAQAADAAARAAAERTRAALLTAVSHDLRTPLAAAKAAISGLRSTDVAWTPAERDELLATAEESLDQLAWLAQNLLDVSRLRAGALRVTPRPAGLDDLVPLALDLLGPPGAAVRVDVPDTLPEVNVDPVLLGRVIANLASNALRHAPADDPPLITASGQDGQVELRVIDTGPGIPAADRERVFTPFQRLGDHDNTTGLGLGLAISRGLVEVMGGSLSPEDTPGGGLTVVVTLPAVASRPTVPTERTSPTGEDS